MSSVTLATERLIVRSLHHDDAGRMAAYVGDNRQHFAETSPRQGESYYTEAFWERQIADIQDAEEHGISLHLILVDNQDPAQPVMGKCTFSAIHRGAFQAAYLGYGLDERAVGQGYMAEALTAAIAHAFGALNLHRIMANYMPSNTRSAALLKRLGFREEGLARDYLYINGRWQDHVMTALTNEKWREDAYV